jgi:hypothetical protein
MLHDIVATQTGRPSVAAWASGLATHLGAEGFPLPDAEFLDLFPGRDFNSTEHWREVEARQAARVQEMAAEWSLRDPHAVAGRLAYLEEEARIANLAWPRWTPILCEGIAQLVASPLTWARALMGVNTGYDLVAPFLRAAYGKQEPEWAKIVEQCLSHGTYKWAAIPMVLALDQPPEGILMRTLSSLPGAGELIKILCLRGEVPVDTLSRLLKHDDPLIAAAAAYGEWNADPRSVVRPALLDDWREAVRQASDDDDYWLREVFVADPSLAYEWLRRRLPEHSATVYRRERAVNGAIGVLDTDQRLSLLQMLDKDSLGGHEMVFRLVGNDLGLYRELLSDEGAKAWHLAPLSGTPEGAWIEKASLALDAGYEPREIARAAYGYPVMTIEWVGKESAKWSEWASKFESLLQHVDQGIRSVGEAGKGIADRRIPGALEEERDEEVYGIGRRRRHI